MSKRKLTEKEQQILDQQRRVAAKLAASASASSSKAIDLTGEPSDKQASLVKKTHQREQVKQVLKRPSSSGKTTNSSSSLLSAVTAATQKRPTLKVKTADAAIQAARRRVAVPTSKPPPPSATQSQSIQRKSSKLTSLISASLSTTASAPPMETGSYGNVEPEDFWRNIRDWDFVSHYVRATAKKTASGKSDKKGQEQQDESADDGILTQKKPLPDRFINHRHYIASWAPLCLAEARAQLLSETLTASNRLVPVTVQARPGVGSTTLDSIAVLVKAKDNPSEHSFLPNDICLLVPEKHRSNVQHALQSKSQTSDSSWRNSSLVGHTENARKALDGLQLKVSKKFWAKVSDGSEDWHLLKIGSNVTALREFTALCRMDVLPLKRYLLGQHLDTAEAKRTNEKHNESATKAELLNKMGGVDALGRGFTDYVHKKFNPSQLQAISASATDYGDGGFTLIKGPPGTGKTTTLVAILNSLHIRQFNKYYEEVKRIASMQTGNRKAALGNAVRAKPRILVCAPSNAAVDNIILKIMEDGFVDGSGNRYNPSIVRVGVGQSASVKDVALENQVDSILSEHMDLGKLESSIAGYKMELQRVQNDLIRLRQRILALSSASQWPLSKDWEIRIDEETFDKTGRVYFVNHKDKTTTFESPPPPEPGETQFDASAMPEYRSFVSRIVKLYESYNSISTKLERCTITQAGLNGGNNIQIRQQMETHILDTVHIVMTTLGTAGNRVLESANKFEVVVVDEAAQSVEPATLSALQLGSKHAILVGDPQQLPATIFNVSGRNTKYDRSLFQRLEEAGHPVFMLNVQYRMDPKISHFPRTIFYGGDLKDGPNVLRSDYGDPLRTRILTSVPAFQPFTVLDLDSKEERGGSSYANSFEARLALHIFCQLRDLTGGLSTTTRVAVITPYSQQAGVLRRVFQEELGPRYTSYVEINTVDAFQGREANTVIFSCVRAAGSHGIGFLSDVRRMNVALTRAKHFLFVIARCKSIKVNPYWRDLVVHAEESNAIVQVPIINRPESRHPQFPDLNELVIPGIVTSRSSAEKLHDNHNPSRETHLLRRDFGAAGSQPPSDPRLKSILPPVPPPPPPPPRTSTDPRRRQSRDPRLAPKPMDPRKGTTDTTVTKPRDPRQP